MTIDKLTLICGTDIPVPELGINIHQPTIKELSVIGEKRFYKYLGYFSITKERVESVLISSFEEELKELNKDKSEIEELVKSMLGDLTDFEILMQMINNKDVAKDESLQEIKEGIETILMYLMPDYTFQFEDRMIFGTSIKEKKNLVIDDEKMKIIKEILDIIFCINFDTEDDFNPANDRANAIANKLKKGREKVRLAKGDNLENKYVLANYISSIGIGTNALNIINAVDLTVYRLFDQMKRFGTKTQHDYGVQSMMAGAKDVELVDWLENQ